MNANMLLGALAGLLALGFMTFGTATILNEIASDSVNKRAFRMLRAICAIILAWVMAYFGAELFIK